MNPEAGLFGPDSITRRIHADPVMGLAGLRALLLQALHPVAMAGVAQHSDFRRDPWGRLRRTAAYLTTVSFGTRDEAEQAAARVRARHHALSGIIPGTSRRYRADDPDLLLWVHCCEVDSFLTTFQRSGGRLGVGEADRYLAEQRTSAELIGIDPQRAPATAAELEGYFRAVRPELRLTPQARQAAAIVLFPPMPRWVGALTPARGAWAGVGLTAVALLPRWARRLYGLPGLPSTDLAASAAARTLRAAAHRLPRPRRPGQGGARPAGSSPSHGARSRAAASPSGQSRR
ncbi:MAG: oxygenase MpaB family protein [Mycobacteriales bacterium]